MKTVQDFNIAKQRDQIVSTKHQVELIAPCKLNDGISSFTSEDLLQFVANFRSYTGKCCLFIPASGSGSRMFEFLYAFLDNPSEENNKAVLLLFQNLQSFAFYDTLSSELKEKIKQKDISLESLARFLLLEFEEKYSELPKAMFPFHRVNHKVLNPFQAHIMQGTMLSNNFAIHFTVPKKYEKLLLSSSNEIDTKFKKENVLTFSEQNPATDSYVFLGNKDLVMDSNYKPLRRPAGHGALLTNLQEISADLIFIKNIDNVQHFSKSDKSNEILMQLGGLTIQLKSEITKLLLSNSKKEVTEFNNRFHLFSDSEMNSMDSRESVFAFLNRPLRVCGMVRNEGQVGGGPFYVLKNGLTQKQIIEKSQIDFTGNQATIFSESTHFNPVIMVLDIKNSSGTNFDLSAFNDEDLYLVVKKNHAGLDVHYVELPGLWNGQMANWSTFFVEIPNEIFSPVKTVLDLLNPLHFEL